MTVRILPAALIVLISLGGCGTGTDRPQTYEDCILDLGRTAPTVQAITTCRHLFPDTTVLPSVDYEARLAEAFERLPLTGQFYLPATSPGGTVATHCASANILTSGAVITPLCGSGSEFSCRGADREVPPGFECTLVCTGRSSWEPTTLFRGFLPRDVAVQIRDGTYEEPEPLDRVLIMVGIPDVIQLRSVEDSTVVMGLSSSLSRCERARLGTP